LKYLDVIQYTEETQQEEWQGKIKKLLSYSKRIEDKVVSGQDKLEARLA